MDRQHRKRVVKLQESVELCDRKKWRKAIESKPNWRIKRKHDFTLEVMNIVKVHLLSNNW